MRVAWRAMLLGPIFQAQGWNDSPFNLFPAKGRYMWVDMARICADAGLDYRQPSTFPRNGLLAARVACAHDEASWLGAFIEAVFRANFARDLDIADPRVIAGCLSACGVDAAAVIEVAQTAAAKLKLRERTSAAADAGIFGAPTFIVDGEIFWGNERLDAALAAAQV